MTQAETRWQVRVNRPIAYDVVKTPDLFAPENDTLMSFGWPQGRRFVVVDGNVMRLHGDRIEAYFQQRGIEAKIVVFPGGEENKTIEIYQDLARKLDAFPIHRRDEPIIAIGGGVLTDVVGFLAASYRRGVPHIKVPTTLMGYIDAALGIKAGINFNGNKNRLGAFEPPRAVLLDRSFLPTLPKRHLLNGVCEIIKLAIIRDAPLLRLLEEQGAQSIANCFSSAEGEAILDAAIGGMLAELAPNLHEEELARRVDFGHTFSYGLETRHEHHLLHGEAVLLDILVSVLIAYHRNLLSEADTARVFALVRTLEIQLDYSVLDAQLMWDALQDRVKHRNGQQRVPMPQGMGRCIFLNDISRSDLNAALSQLPTWTAPHNEHAFER
ncbi:MAG: 2-epi-5-epi-valiolone synthase [Rhodanobacter sp. SCN 67-45]|jgi:3-dehydroquinate synthase|nr:MAG: 2-epi-5-epi-valiolone synthase [Rhodanobacter sp. SCN 67-45]